MKKIGIIAKNIPAARIAAKKLTRWLEMRGKSVFIENETAEAIKAKGLTAAPLFRYPSKDA